MLGFQLTTALISMCIVNTAAVAMMLPILTAVTCELYPKVDDQVLELKNMEIKDETNVASVFRKFVTF